MTDNPNKRGKQDRARVAKGQDHEVYYLTRRYKITREQAIALIDKHKGNRAKINAELTETVAQPE